MVQFLLQNSDRKVVFLGGSRHQREWKYLGHLSVKHVDNERHKVYDYIFLKFK